MREVGDQVPVGVEHLCADRDVELDVGAVGAVLARAAARLAAARAEARLRAEPREIAPVGVGDQDHVAAAAAVAAVRAAARHELLPAEADRAVAAAARLDLDAGAVCQHGV